MKRRVLAISCVVLGGASVLSAKAQATPMNGCMTEFYDSASYNWLAYRNSCGQAVYAVWVSGTPGLNGGGRIDSGAKAVTGWSANEVRSHGGMWIYACPVGYMPADPATGNMVWRHVAQYQCVQNSSAE